MLFCVICYIGGAILWDIDMYNIDGSMNRALYVVHLTTKKLQAQKHFKVNVGFTMFFPVGGGIFNTAQDGLQELVGGIR